MGELFDKLQVRMGTTPLLKVVIAGDGNVGKTSLIRRYCEGKFDVSRAETIGVDFQTKLVELTDGLVKLSIWDMAGQERFQVVRTSFYRGSKATALVFDLIHLESLMNLYKWYLEIKEILPEQKFLVVGNKSDLSQNRGFGWAGDRFARLIGADFVKTSALTGEGVKDMFEKLATIALKESLR